MKYLILVRHAQAENSSFSVVDMDRKLTDKGIAVAKMQALRLKNSGYLPDMIVSSCAKRAKQTANEFLETFKLETVQEQAFLYDDYTTQQFVSWVRMLPNKNHCCILVAHNPTISNIAFRLTGKQSYNFEPATLAVLLFKCKSWTDIAVGSGTLERLLLPTME